MFRCCKKKLLHDVHDPANAAPPKLTSSCGLIIELDANFVVGAEYEQEDLPEHARGMPLPATLAYCEERAAKRGSAGFFYQQHQNGHEIVGFYANVAALHGRRVWHGHFRGFVAVPPPASARFDLKTDANFVVGAEYEQEDLPEHARDMPLPATLAYCEERAVKRGSAGFFYQQHQNGHEIVGFFATAECMALGSAGWHGHRRGLVASLKPDRHGEPDPGDDDFVHVAALSQRAEEPATPKFNVALATVDSGAGETYRCKIIFQVEEPSLDSQVKDVEDAAALVQTSTAAIHLECCDDEWVVVEKA